MADLYHVRFAVNSEPTSARFEFEENAKAFADRLSFTGITAKVTDEFADRGENPVYVAEPQSLPNGVYLIADTPPTAHALAVEDGSGDRGLLRECLQEQEAIIEMKCPYCDGEGEGGEGNKCYECDGSGMVDLFDP